MNKRGVILDFPVERDGQEVLLEVKSTVYYGSPPVWHSLPENSYPGDPDEVDFQLFLEGKPWDGELTGKEEDDLRVMLIEHAHDDEEYDDEDPPSDRYDDDPVSNCCDEGGY